MHERDAHLVKHPSSHLEAGDLLAFLYALVLVRQAFWLVPGAGAWALSIATAALLGVLRLRSRGPRPRLPRAFWLGVAAPVTLYWVIHLPYPDTAFDVLSYHLMHGERALRGLLAIPGDFYPHYFPYLNPAPDMLTGLLRKLLGYRLGTAGSCLVLVWTGAIVFRLLGRAIARPAWRALATLWIIGSEGMLWEVGNYMVDIYGLPLLLEAAALVLPPEEGAPDRDPFGDLPLTGLLLGAAVAFKLTNLVFVVAIGAAFLLRAVAGRAAFGCSRATRQSLLAAAGFALPLLAHTAFVWWTTGSPLFPHYNAFFRSPLYPANNILDVRFGPTSRLQALVWPLLSAWRPERLSELGVASGRLALGFVGALAALVLPHHDRRLRGLALIAALGSVLWSLGTGNHRYGLFVELAGGLVLVLLAVRGAAAARDVPALRRVAWLPAGLLAAQSALVFRCLARPDWGEHPLFFHDPADRAAAWSDLRRLGSDRDLSRELPAGVRTEVTSAAGWVDVSEKTGGLMALLAPELPMIGLRTAAMFWAPANLPRFDEAMRAVQGRPLVSLAFADQADAARRDLALYGFVIRRETRFTLPLFSRVRQLDLVGFVVDAPPPVPVAAGRSARVPTARELLLRRPPPRLEWREDSGLLGSIDQPAAGAEVSGEVLVRGWAREPGEDLLIDVTIDGVGRSLTSFRRTPREDVAAALPSLAPCPTAGYEAVVPLRPEDVGTRLVGVVFRSRDGRLRHYPPTRVAVRGSN